MERPTGATRRRRALVAAGELAVVALAFAHAVRAGWGRWGSLLFDTGRELELPRRLAEGERLYSDLRWYYGPLAPHVNALLYRAFGVHADVLVWAGICSAVAMALLLRAIASALVPRGVAVALTISFVYVCAFQHLAPVPIFQFALPYTYAATYGIVCATASLWLLLRHLASGASRADLPLSVAALALALLSKLEPAVPALAAHLVVVVARVRAGAMSRRSWIAYGLGALAVAAVYGGLVVLRGTGVWTENLAALGSGASRAYVVRTSGLLEPGESLAAMVRSGLALFAVAAVAWVGALRLARSRALPEPLAVGGGVALVAAGVARWIGVTEIFRALPLLLLAAAGALAGAVLRRRRDGAPLVPMLAVATFGAVALLRIALRASPHHYGFYLLPPALLAFAALSARELPRWSKVPALPWGCAVVGLLAGASADAWRTTAAAYEGHAVAVETPRGSFLVPEFDRDLAGAVRALAAVPPTATVACVPQGAAMAFLAERPTVDAMFSYLPMEIHTVAQDEAAVRRWRESPPDVVVAVLQDTSEYGKAGFGLDYAVRTGAWIAENYRPATPIGSAVIVLERRPGEGRAQPAAQR
ncbi:MAG TPA: hypothetical protein VFL83_21405 [Anaeromyxobacter sp.]|nr:hypothetical protein [Anaeromyxobacter sp.]